MSSGNADWLTDRPIRNGENMSLGDEGAVYNPDTGGLHVLNASALAIWDLCDGATTGGEMADAISELTGLDTEQARADVSRTLGRLFQLGLVRRT